MDLLELPDPLFPYILSLVPVNARLGLWSVSTVWNETIVQSLRDVAVVRETYDDVIMEWRGYVVIRAHYLTTEILKVCQRISISIFADLLHFIRLCQRLFKRLPSLRYLNLCAPVTTAVLEESLPFCPPTLQVLKIHNHDDYNSLKPIASMPCSLTTLRISWSTSFQNSLLYLESAGSDNEELRDLLENFVKVVEKHGPTLRRLSFQNFDPFSSQVAFLARIAALVPNLHEFDLAGEHYKLFPNVTTYKCQYLVPELINDVKGNLTTCWVLDTKSSDWEILSDPRLTTLKSLQVHGGTLLVDTWDDDPPLEQLTNVTGVFKNNPDLRFLDLCFYPHQVDSFACYLRNLTRMFFFCNKFPLRTWRILGRELKSLVCLKTLDCHDLGDAEMEAWASEMPENYPLRHLQHLYSSVTLIGVAQHVAPKCPHLAEVVGEMCEDTLLAWANIGRPLRAASWAPRAPVKSESCRLFFQTCGRELLSLRIIPPVSFPNDSSVTLNDSIIEDLVTLCPKLHSIDMEYILGVSPEGWKPLQRLRSLQYVNIGSDTCPQEFQEAIARFKTEFYHQTPAARAEKEAQRVQKENERRERIKAENALALEWGAKFVGSKRENLIATCLDVKLIPEKAKEWAYADPALPQNSNLKKVALKGVWNEAQKLKGQLLQQKNKK